MKISDEELKTLVNTLHQQMHFSHNDGLTLAALRELWQRRENERWRNANVELPDFHIPWVQVWCDTKAIPERWNTGKLLSLSDYGVNDTSRFWWRPDRTDLPETHPSKKLPTLEDMIGICKAPDDDDLPEAER